MQQLERDSSPGPDDDVIRSYNFESLLGFPLKSSNRD
jgi:hypothetical protein